MSLVAVAGCNSDGDQELSRTFGEMASKENETVVKMADATPFPWERLHVFGPYTTAETVENELGFSWWRSNAIESNDHFALLVFVRGGKVVRFVIHPRGNGDLAACNRRGGFSPADATFRCQKDAQGVARCQTAG
ncbi:MAG TPA: hypothetical protein VGG33_13805 [Polyangia bacterium]